MKRRCDNITEPIIMIPKNIKAIRIELSVIVLA